MKITSRTVEHSQSGQARPDTFFPKLVSVFGSDRLMWGSNFPAHDDSLPNILKETLHALSALKQEDLAMILAGTAETLYPTLK